MYSGGEVKKLSQRAEALIRQAESNLQTARQLEEETPWYVTLFRDGSAEKKSKQKMGLAEEQLSQARDQLYKFSNPQAAIAYVKKALKNSVEAQEAVHKTDQTIIRRGTTVSEIGIGAGTGLLILGTAGAGAIAAGAGTAAGAALYGASQSGLAVFGAVTTPQILTFGAVSAVGGAMGGHLAGAGISGLRSLATDNSFNYSPTEQMRFALEGASIGLMQGTSPFAAATGVELAQSVPRSIITLPNNVVIEGTLLTRGAMRLAPIAAANASIAAGTTAVMGGDAKDLRESMTMSAGITLLNGGIFGTIHTLQNLKGARVRWGDQEGIVIYTQGPSGLPTQIASRTRPSSKALPSPVIEEPDGSLSRTVGNALLNFAADETGSLNLRRVGELARRIKALIFQPTRSPSQIEAESVPLGGGGSNLVAKVLPDGVRKSFSPESAQFFEAFAIDIMRQGGVRGQICEALSKGQFVEVLTLLAEAPDLVVYIDVQVVRGALEYGKPHRLDPRFPKALEELAAAANQETNFKQSDQISLLAQKAKGDAALPPPKLQISLDPRAVNFLREQKIDGTQDPLTLLSEILSPKHLEAVRDRSGDGLLLVVNLVTHLRKHGAAFQRMRVGELLEWGGFNPDGSLNPNNVPSYRSDPLPSVKGRDPVENVGARTAAIRAGKSHGVVGELGGGSTYEVAFRNAFAADSALLDFWQAALKSVGSVDSPEKFSAAFILVLREFIAQFRKTNAPEYYKEDADALVQFIRESLGKTGVDLEAVIMDDEGALEDYETLRSFQRGETVIGDAQSFLQQLAASQNLDPVIATWPDGLSQKLIDLYLHHPRLVAFIEKQRRLAENIPIGPLGPFANKNLPSFLCDAFGQNFTSAKHGEGEALGTIIEIMALVEKVRAMGVRVFIREDLWNEAKGFVLLSSLAGIRSFFVGPISAQKDGPDFREHAWVVGYGAEGNETTHSVVVGDRDSVSAAGKENGFVLSHNHRADGGGASLAFANKDIVTFMSEVSRYMEGREGLTPPTTSFYRDGKFYNYLFSEEGMAVLELDYASSRQGDSSSLRVYFSLRPGSGGDGAKVRATTLQNIFFGATGVEKYSDLVQEVPWEEHFTHPAFQISAPQAQVRPGAKTIVRYPPPPPAIDLVKLAPRLSSPADIQSFFMGPVLTQNDSPDSREYGWMIVHDEQGRETKHYVAIGDRRSVHSTTEAFMFAHNHIADGKGVSLVPSHNDNRAFNRNVRSYLYATGVKHRIEAPLPETSFYRNGKFYHFIFSEEGITVMEIDRKLYEEVNPRSLRIYFSIKPGSAVAAEKIKRTIFADTLLIDDADVEQFSDLVVEVPWVKHSSHSAFQINVPQTVVYPGAKKR